MGAATAVWKGDGGEGGGGAGLCGGGAACGNGERRHGCDGGCGGEHGGEGGGNASARRWRRHAAARGRPVTRSVHC